MVEFVEFSLLLGFDRIFMYVKEMKPEVMRVSGGCGGGVGGCCGGRDGCCGGCSGVGC